MHTYPTTSLSALFQSGNTISLQALHQAIVSLLSERYEMGEARAMSFVLLEDAFGVGRTDIYADKGKYFSEEETERLHAILSKMHSGIPLQYALGEAKFGDRMFYVDSSTLIPRPETEELVAWCLEEIHHRWHLPTASPSHTPRLLDAGTGSGCIAISLAAQLGTPWQVDAWDISPEALRVAQRNATRHGVKVDFSLVDLLSSQYPNHMYDVIVSNPPYICHSEAQEMERHVLDYEPHTALFVPDDDALRFYRALCQLCQHRLRPGGLLLVEANRAFAQSTATLLETYGFKNVTIRPDAYGELRMVGGERGEVKGER